MLCDFYFSKSWWLKTNEAETWKGINEWEEKSGDSILKRLFKTLQSRGRGMKVLAVGWRSSPLDEGPRLRLGPLSQGHDPASFKTAIKDLISYSFIPLSVQGQHKNNFINDFVS